MEMVEIIKAICFIVGGAFTVINLSKMAYKNAISDLQMILWSVSVSVFAYLQFVF